MKNELLPFFLAEYDHWPKILFTIIFFIEKSDLQQWFFFSREKGHDSQFFLRKINILLVTDIIAKSDMMLIKILFYGQK